MDQTHLMSHYFRIDQWIGSWIINWWVGVLFRSPRPIPLLPGYPTWWAESLENHSNSEFQQMDVSENRDTPKWIVYNGKPYVQMDDLGGKPTIFGKHPQITDWFTLPETNISMWKMEVGRLLSFFWRPLFRGPILVEGIVSMVVSGSHKKW